MGISIEQYRARIDLFNYCRTYSVLHLSVMLVSLQRVLAFLKSSLVVNPVFPCMGFPIHLQSLFFQFFYALYFLYIILQSWDIENNPGPVSKNLKSLTVSHWNLNSVWVDDFALLSQILAYLSVHKFDILCFSETFLDSFFLLFFFLYLFHMSHIFLDSSILDDDPRLAIDGYNLIHCDHPSNSRNPSLFPRCHHQLIYAKIKFKMYFPPTYTRRIWDFPRRYCRY